MISNSRNFRSCNKNAKCNIYRAIPLCAISLLCCFPSNCIMEHALVAFAAANMSCGAIATAINTLPPLVTRYPSLKAVPQ